MEDPFVRAPSSSAIAERLAEIFRCARELESASKGDTRGIRRKPLVLFGAGALGQMTLAHLRRLGMSPVAMADNDRKRWGDRLDEIPIVSPAEAVRCYGDMARFVVTVYNGSAARRQLSQLGCAQVMHLAELYFEYPEEFLPYGGLASRQVALDAPDEVAKAAHVWYDARSTREYLAQLAWRLRVPDCELPPHDSPADCYFPVDVFRFLNDEVLFDCGAYDGDSIRQYLQRRPCLGNPTILALEPDEKTLLRLKAFVCTLPDGLAQRVRIEPWAVAEKSGEVRFASLGSVRSVVTGSGECSVSAVAIDDIDLAPTLIKMDVEGFELSALKGGATVIQRDLPVLAISIYHHADDLWKIPNFLKALAPDYRLFLRRYAEDCWEMVLYAVPASRILAAV